MGLAAVSWTVQLPSGAPGGGRTQSQKVRVVWPGMGPMSGRPLAFVSSGTFTESQAPSPSSSRATTCAPAASAVTRSASPAQPAPGVRSKVSAASCPFTSVSAKAAATPACVHVEKVSGTKAGEPTWLQSLTLAEAVGSSPLVAVTRVTSWPVRPDGIVIRTWSVLLAEAARGTCGVSSQVPSPSSSLPMTTPASRISILAPWLLVARRPTTSASLPSFASVWS